MTDPEPDGASTRALIHRIGDDVRTIARDEVELVRDELQRAARSAAIDVAAISLGVLVAVIGFMLLLVAGVAAIAPRIGLVVSLVLGAIVYGVIGAVTVRVFAARLRGALPDMSVPIHEARSVVKATRAAIEARGQRVHA